MSFLEHLSASARARLLALATPRRLDAGQVLLRRGAPGGDLFLLEQGELEVLDTQRSPPMVLDVLHPGEVIGEIGFIDRGPRTADVRARTACTCRAWEAEPLRAALQGNPPLAAEVHRALALTAATHLRAEAAARAAGVRPPAPHGAADPLVIELVEQLDRAWHAAGEAPAPGLGEALRAIAAALAPLAGSQRADAMGAALLDATGERLSQARTGSLLLARRPGGPASPALWRHLAAGQPEGSSPRGRALDAALLALPALRGVAWRAEALPAALAELSPGPGEVVLLVAPAHALLQQRLTRSAEARGAQLQVLGQRPDGAADVDALLALAQGRAPAGLPPARLAVVELVPDLLPDRLLAGLLHTAARQLPPGGALLVGHATPSPDLALLDHLLRWPLLPRSADELAGLLARTPGLAAAAARLPPPGVAAALGRATVGAA